MDPCGNLTTYVLARTRFRRGGKMDPCGPCAVRGRRHRHGRNGDALVDNTKLAKGEGEPTTVETDEVSAKKKEESGKIMSKEGRSSGRVGLTTARDAAASADSRCVPA